MGKEYGRRKNKQFCTYLIIPASPSVQLSSYVSNQLLRTRGGFLSVSLLQGGDSTGAASTLPGGTQLSDAVSSHGISSGEGQVWVLCLYSASSTRGALAVTWGFSATRGRGISVGQRDMRFTGKGTGAQRAQTFSLRSLAVWMSSSLGVTAKTPLDHSSEICKHQQKHQSATTATLLRGGLQVSPATPTSATPASVSGELWRCCSLWPRLAAGSISMLCTARGGTHLSTQDGPVVVWL